MPSILRSGHQLGNTSIRPSEAPLSRFARRGYPYPPAALAAIVERFLGVLVGIRVPLLSP